MRNMMVSLFKSFFRFQRRKRYFLFDARRVVGKFCLSRYKHYLFCSLLFWQQSLSKRILFWEISNSFTHFSSRKCFDMQGIKFISNQKWAKENRNYKENMTRQVQPPSFLSLHKKNSRPYSFSQAKTKLETPSKRYFHGLSTSFCSFIDYHIHGFAHLHPLVGPIWVIWFTTELLRLFIVLNLLIFSRFLWSILSLFTPRLSIKTSRALFVPGIRKTCWLNHTFQTGQDFKHLLTISPPQ